MEPGRDPESDIEALEHELAEYGDSQRTSSTWSAGCGSPSSTRSTCRTRGSWSTSSAPTLEKRGLDGLPGQRGDRGGPDRARLRAGRAPSRRTGRACRRWSRPGSRSRPKAVDDSGFTVERDPEDPDAFVVRGVRAERWVRQTDFSNDEAVGFLADRLNRLGVEEQLAKAGARRGRRGHDRRGHLRLGAHAAGRDAHDRGVRGSRRPRHRQPDRRAAPGARGRSGWPRKKPRRVPYELSEPRPGRGRPPGGAAVTAARPGDRRRPSGRGQGRLLVADHRCPAAWTPHRLEALVDVLGAVRAAGREVVLVSSGAIAAGLAPLLLTGRPRDLATAQAAASVGPAAAGADLRRRVRPARPHRRPGAAHRRRPDPPQPLPQRPPHRGAAALARRAAHRERERHGRDRGDPVRRQRPAGRAGRARRPGRGAGPAVRRRRCVRRRPAHGARAAAATRARRGRPGRRRPSARPAATASAPAGWRPRSRPRSSPRTPACPSSSPPPSRRRPRWPGNRSARCSRRRAAGPASRLFWLRHARRRAGSWSSTRAPSTRSYAGVRSLLSAGVTGVPGEFGADDPVELVGPDGVAVARGLVGYDAAELPELLGRSSRELDPEHRREVVHRDEMVLVGRRSAS